MATSTAPAQSKSAKKKAAKAAERSDSPAPSALSGTEKAGDVSNDGFESPYIKELQKSIRNINKKLSNTSKTETLVAQHPKKSLDELIAERIINADQKAQIQKKPALESQLAQTEESLAQYIKVDQQYKTQAATDKAERDDAIAKAKSEATEQAKAESKKDLRSHLLLLSQYLRLAAFRRGEDVDPESDESQAIEGALSAVYSGDESAVDAMLSLVEGSNEKVLGLAGEPLQTSWNDIKSLSQTAYQEPVEAEVETRTEVGTDPTVAHATASELESGDLILTNGVKSEADAAPAPTANAAVADDAANAVAESQWDSKDGLSASMQDSWVDVKRPRDPTETETGVQATPAAPSNTQSWADDQPETAQQPTPPADANDGFHQVQGRNRGRQERDGSTARGGRGGRGQHRGGRGRGDGAGRGQRGNRNNGGQGGQGRGPRRNEES